MPTYELVQFALAITVTHYLTINEKRTDIIGTQKFAAYTISFGAT